jgi:hypothetical protein
MSSATDNEFAAALAEAMSASRDAGAVAALKTLCLALLGICALTCLVLDDVSSREIADATERARQTEHDECAQSLSVAYGFVAPSPQTVALEDASLGDSEAAPPTEGTSTDAADGYVEDGLLVFDPLRCVERERVCDEHHDAVDLPSCP